MFKQFQLLFFVFTAVFISTAQAQESDNPKFYIDQKGTRFNEYQFDSLKTANMGKPIALKDVLKKENSTEITFENLTINPNQVLFDKWIDKPLPSFQWKDLSGKQFTNQSLKGKVVVLNFWSTTCVPCIEEIPTLNILKNMYAGKNVIFLAPAPEDVTKIKKTIAKRDFNYTIIPDATSLFTTLGLEGYPFHFVIDQSGNIQAIYSGSRFNTQTNKVELDSRLIGAIDKLL